MRVDGINIDMESRFFFEDEGHVRRLTTDQTNFLMSQHSFVHAKDFYSNQYYGAIQWISQSAPKFILDFTNPGKAINGKASKCLSNVRLKLVILFVLQLPCLIHDKINLVRKKRIKDYLIRTVNFLPFLLSYPIYAVIDHKARKEWGNEKESKNGSEMYLFYKDVN